MDLAHPLALVSPGVHGRVLTVLVRAGAPLTGRGVAQLVHPPVSVSGVQRVLNELVAAGLVHRTLVGRSQLHSLNRDHLSAAAVAELVGARQRLIGRLQELSAGWTVPARGLWLCGSVARNQGGSHSDLDVVAVRSSAVPAEDRTWLEQLERLSAAVLAWTGNGCEVLELGENELTEWREQDERLLVEIGRDAVVLSGQTPGSLGVGLGLRT